MTAGQGALLAVLGGAVFLDGWPAVQTMLSRPVVVGALAGLILGAPAEGAVWGAAFEAVFLGVLPVGAARYPDAGAGALAGTAVALSGAHDGVHPAGLAVAIALAASRLGAETDRWQRRWNGGAARRVGERVAAGDLSAPGRATGLALARGALVGALQTGVAVGAGLAALAWLGGSPWTGPLPLPGVAVAGLAMAAAAGLGAFGDRDAPVPRGRAAAAVLGGAAGALLGGWISP